MVFLRRAFAFVAVAVAALAIARCAMQPVIVHGDSYVYSIPPSYQKNPHFFWKLAGIEGDPTSITYLQIPTKEVPALVGLYSLRLFLFHDKSYGMDSLTNYANRVVQESIKAANSGDLYRYTKNTTTETTDYYFSFDPTVTGTSHVTERDFDARVSMLEPLTVGDSSTTPRPGCEISFLYDGILIDASVIGAAVCEAPNLVTIRDVVESFMEEWRLKAADSTHQR